MLIHQQNSYAPRGKRRTEFREAQSREPVSKFNKFSVLRGRISLAYSACQTILPSFSRRPMFLCSLVGNI
jgi:hypothetical protein